MTEKRYKEVDVLDNVIYINGNIIGYQQLCDLLNKREEENRQLRLELDTHKHPLWSTREAERIVNELKRENEQLKHQLSQQEMGYATDLHRLSEENKQLKQAYNDAKKDVEKKEQILKDIMEDNLLIQDIKKELE